MVWLTFFKYYRLKYAITTETKAIYVINVCFIFTMQMILLAAVYYQLTNENSAEGGSITMSMQHFDVLLTRFICAFLMHMQSEPEIRQAMAMFKYTLNHERVKDSLQTLIKRVYEEYKRIDEDAVSKGDKHPTFKIKKVTVKKSDDGKVVSREESVREVTIKELEYEANPSDEQIGIYWDVLKSYYTEQYRCFCLHPMPIEFKFLLTAAGQDRETKKMNL